MNKPLTQADRQLAEAGCMNRKHTPGLTGQLDYYPPNTSGSEGIAFVIYPAGTSEPLAEVLQREGAEAIAQRLVQCVNAHDDMLAALRWSDQFNRRPDESYTACFERIGEVFYREVGCLRPGKDASPQSGLSREERQAKWDAWIAAGIARVRAAIARATGEAA